MFCGVSDSQSVHCRNHGVFSVVCHTALFSTAPGCGGRPFTHPRAIPRGPLAFGWPLLDANSLGSAGRTWIPSFRRQRQSSPLFCGMIFAIGLEISGMSTPSKTLGFLNFFHPTAWDPSLLGVVLGRLLPNMWTWMRQIRTLEHRYLIVNSILPQSQIFRIFVNVARSLILDWGLKEYLSWTGSRQLWKPIGDVDGLVWFAGVTLGAD